MCGRYSFSKAKELKSKFGVDISQADVKANYNVGPTHTMPIIIEESGNYVLKMMQWGLLPAFAKDKKQVAQMINARAETLGEKPSFRPLLKANRCLVPADGFYEFEHRGKEIRPVRFILEDEKVFCFAGLYSEWTNPLDSQETLQTYTVITTEPNALVQPIHDRMPLILPEEWEKEWLNPELQSYEQMTHFFRSYNPEKMKAYYTHPNIRNIKNNRAEWLAEYTYRDLFS